MKPRPEKSWGLPGVVKPTIKRIETPILDDEKIPKPKQK